MAEQAPSAACAKEIESDCNTPRPETSTDSSEVQSFLSRFRAPRRSDLTRKRKVCQNTDRGVLTLTKKKPSCSTDPTSVTQSQRDREFPEEALTVSAGKLFCTACREEVSLKRSIIKDALKRLSTFVGCKLKLIGMSGNVTLPRL